ncbi:MAG: ABC transporter ATP-binding protein [Candidatus Omnitrophica bacterium]|nr:ABC transporter ATP-binding protein [Candidatus Omnitrophota bacterium]
MSKTIFELENLSYSYLNKFPALVNINLKIESGEKVALLGANGTGKSTLLHILDALVFPDTGRIRFFGRDLNENAFNDEKFSREFRRRVGLVFQSPDVQLFCPTVKEDIVFGPLQLGVTQNEIKKRMDRLIEILNIRDFINRQPHQLSVGEKKKVSIASVLIIEPEVLLLDEPTAGLDPATCRQLLDLIDDFHAQGKTVITATHDLHMVPELAEGLRILNKERTITADGSCQEILANQDLLKQNNLVHIHKHRHDGSWHKHPHQHSPT